MNAKAILAALLLLLGIAAWVALRNPDSLEVPPSLEPATPRTPDATPTLVTSTPEAGVADASAPSPSPNEVRDAVSTHAAAVPLPENAQWVDVRIVDKANGNLVPGATVVWQDERVDKFLQEDKSLDIADRFTLVRDIEERDTRFGWHTTSDAHGLARVHLANPTDVTARLGARCGQLTITKGMLAPRDGFRIELDADSELLVQAIDTRGKPAFGIPIAISIHDEKGNLRYVWNWGPTAMTRAPDGIARIRHLQVLKNEREAAQLRVRLQMPGYEDPGTEFRIEDPPTAPIVLRLPECGRVRVRVEVSGQPVVDVGSIFLTNERSRRSWNSGQASFERKLDPDGWARFPYVPLGTTCSSYTSLFGGSLYTTFPGPVQADAEVSAVLSPSDQQIQFIGRLLDERRVPLPTQKFKLIVNSPHVGNEVEITTDVSGRFRAIVGHARNENHADAIVAEVAREGQRPMSARLAARELHAGVEDLGDMVLRLDALLVSGRYLLDGKPTKVRPSVRLESFESNAQDQSSRWSRAAGLLYQQDDEGRFEYRGAFEPGRYRLRFMAGDHLPHDPVEFDSGAKDLEIGLLSGTPLAATMLLPPDGRDEPVVQLVPADGAAQGSAPEAKSNRLLVANRDSWRPDGRLQVRWRTLPAGSYSLEIRLTPIAKPVFRIDAVQVPPPDGGDPRLVDIDLRSILRVQTVRLFDLAGKPVDESDAAFFPLTQDMSKDLSGFPCQGRESKFYVPQGPLDLQVAVSGYRPQTIRCTGEPVDVRLDAWPTITLMVPGLDKLPENTTLQMQLRPENPSQQRYRTNWNSGMLRELTAPSQRAHTVRNGKVELPIGDGPHFVTAFVIGKNTRIPVEMPPLQALSTTGQITVQLPPDKLAAAIEKSKAPEK